VLNIEEGAHHPTMMSVGLHGLISGHPARTLAVARYLDCV
jgi:allantoinase